jgi:hypothetical protein
MDSSLEAAELLSFMEIHFFTTRNTADAVPLTGSSASGRDFSRMEPA